MYNVRRRYIQVDIYGSCGTMRCLRTDNDRCRKLLNEDYKFYLSFENSNCDYYITEKFYDNGLRLVIQARFPFKRNRLRCVRCVNENRKKRKRLRWQAANHGCHCFDRAFLLADACVCCVKFSLAFLAVFVYATHVSDCVWMETGLRDSIVSFGLRKVVLTEKCVHVVIDYCMVRCRLCCSCFSLSIFASFLYASFFWIKLTLVYSITLTQPHYKLWPDALFDVLIRCVRSHTRWNRVT